MTADAARWLKCTARHPLWPIVLLSSLMLASPARADAVGADLPLLGQLIISSAQQLSQLQEQLATLRQSYEEVRTVAGYADDAAKAFQAFQADKGDFGQPLQDALFNTFPDLAYFDRQARSSGPWAQGTGELQLHLRACLSAAMSGSACAEVEQALSVQDVSHALDATFGPARTNAGRAATREAAIALAASQAQVQRDALTSEHARKLSALCTGSEGQALASCQAAAGLAQVETLAQTAALSDQLAESNRLAAIDAARSAARDAAEQGGRLQQLAALQDGAVLLTRPPPSIHAPGAGLFEAGGSTSPAAPSAAQGSGAGGAAR